MLPIIRILTFMTLCYGCKNHNKVYPDKERNKVDPDEERHCGGIPNIGNTCYVNSCVQISSRLYPNLFSHMKNDLGRHGQAIVNKIAHDSSKEHVTAEEAQQFCDALLDSYNKKNSEKLKPGDQEDAAPVFDFILREGGVQRIALYPTTVDPKGIYPTITNNTPANYFVLPVNFTSDHTSYSMDALVANTLRGNHVEDFIWRRPGDREIRGNALAGNKLSLSNLHGLTNRILPIWTHRFIQASNNDPSSATKITTSIETFARCVVKMRFFSDLTDKYSIYINPIYHD